LELFLNTGCAQCHRGAGLGGAGFQRMGVANAYANTNDLGRARITLDEGDRFKFKVPSLRNVAMTAPYFHDNGAATLASAVRQMGHLQLDRRLSPGEVEAIETFLRALSDKKLAVHRSPTPAAVQAALSGGMRRKR
jgi:cytochrome c peroxidase